MGISVIFNFFLVQQALHSLALPYFISSWIPHKDSANSVKQATIGTAFTKKSSNSHILLYGVVNFF
jgi:hypothetical protein